MLSNMMRRLGIGRKVNLERGTAGNPTAARNGNGPLSWPDALKTTLPEAARALGMSATEADAPLALLASKVIRARLSVITKSEDHALAMSCHLAYCAERHRAGSAVEFIDQTRPAKYETHEGDWYDFPEMDHALECRLLAQMWAETCRKTRLVLEEHGLVLNQAALELIEAHERIMAGNRTQWQRPFRAPDDRILFEIPKMAASLENHLDGGEDYQAIESRFLQYLRETPDTQEIDALAQEPSSVVPGVVLRHSRAPAAPASTRDLVKFLRDDNCTEIFQNPLFNEQAYQAVAGALIEHLRYVHKHGGKIIRLERLYEEAWKRGWRIGDRNVTKAAEIATAPDSSPGEVMLSGLACIPEMAEIEEVAERILKYSRSNNAVNQMLQFSIGAKWKRVVSQQLRTLEYTGRDAGGLAQALAFATERNLQGVEASDLVEIVAAPYPELRSQGIRLMSLVQSMSRQAPRPRTRATTPS